MTRDMVGLAFLLLVTVAIFAYWRHTLRAHEARIDALDVRIHVNGIRGKSTVTRLLAAVLREAGYRTVAKTTGSAARVIGPTGEEAPIPRRGAATINEQIDIVREHVSGSVDALVIECMAIRPIYQQYSQDRIVRSDITVITNVREDHQEEMGETLEQIADSLSETIPRGGILVTSEDRPRLQERLRRNAAARDCRFVVADEAMVNDEEMSGFDHLQFKANVAIGIEVAHLLGIARHVAVEGMWKAVADVGVVRLRWYDLRGKRVLWVPLLAANDRESVILTFQTLQAQFPAEATVIGILNNRADRGRRAELFAAMVPADLSGYLDQVITFGAYEDAVIPAMIARGYPADRIHRLGDSVDPTLDQILDAVAAMIPGPQGVLVGMVNIHTPQAELLIDYFAQAHAGAPDEDEITASRSPTRAPRSLQRLYHAASHPESHHTSGGTGTDA
jgi:poly-gamma-glutamate synthase PgsB/CapB